MMRVVSMTVSAEAVLGTHQLALHSSRLSQAWRLKTWRAAAPNSEWKDIFDFSG
jgi:maltooligosyltrehalose synthase